MIVAADGITLGQEVLIMDAETLRQKIGSLLWQGRISDASELLAEEGADLDSQIEKAQATLDSLKAKQAVIKEIAAGREGEQCTGNIEPQISPIDKEQRREQRKEQVLDLAKKIADKQGRIQTHALVSQVIAEKIDLGVPENRIATSVSNILRTKGKCTKVGMGLYQLTESAST